MLISDLPPPIRLERYIAFLRAINVGGHTVKMESLRTRFEELGFSNVTTFIASGNVIFEAADQDVALLEQQLAGHLQDALGYEVATFIRTAPELSTIANYQPFPAENYLETSSLYIGFLHTPPTQEALQKLKTYGTELNQFHAHHRELYWLCHTRISDSPFSGALLERTLRMPVTLRNSTTIKKLAAKVAALTPSAA